jgi:hypothetical protein
LEEYWTLIEAVRDRVKTVDLIKKGTAKKGQSNIKKGTEERLLLMRATPHKKGLRRVEQRVPASGRQVWRRLNWACYG